MFLFLHAAPPPVFTGLRRTSTLPLTLTSARPPTRAWEVARTVVAPPSSVVKCLWEVFVWGFGALFLSCVCVSRVLFSVGVCICDLLIFLHAPPPLVFTGLRVPLICGKYLVPRALPIHINESCCVITMLFTRFPPPVFTGLRVPLICGKYLVPAVADGGATLIAGAAIIYIYFHTYIYNYNK